MLSSIWKIAKTIMFEIPRHTNKIAKRIKLHYNIKKQGRFFVKIDDLIRYCKIL